MIRAARVLGGDLTGVELIASVASQMQLPMAGDDDAEGAEQNVNGNGHAQPQRTATMYSADGDEYAAAYEGVSDEDARTFRRSLARTMSSNGLRDAESVAESLEGMQVQERYLDVSEADVARMIPRVISHRLRVRDGPQDEVLGSALFGAVDSEASEGRGEGTTTTVKDVLVRILAEV